MRRLLCRRARAPRPQESAIAALSAGGVALPLRRLAHLSYQLGAHFVVDLSALLYGSLLLLRLARVPKPASITAGTVPLLAAAYPRLLSI